MNNTMKLQEQEHRKTWYRLIKELTQKLNRTQSLTA